MEGWGEDAQGQQLENLIKKMLYHGKERVMECSSIKV